MAIKLSSEDLAALNIGESQVTRGYIGTTEIYPNDIAITSASYDDASISNAGGSTGYTVTGTVGAQFYFETNANYTGSPATGVVTNMPGSSNVQTIGSSGTATFSPSIGQRQTCYLDAAIPGTNAYNQIKIVPVAPTIMGTGVSQFDYIAQDGGPDYGSWQLTMSPTITVIDGTTVDVGGTKYWAANTAEWNVRFSYTGLSPNTSQGGSTYSNFHWGDGTKLWMRGIAIERVTNPAYQGWTRSNLQNNLGMSTNGTTPTWYYSTGASTVQTIASSGEFSCNVKFTSNVTEATFNIWWQASTDPSGTKAACWSMNNSSPGYHLYQVNLGSVSTGVAT